MADDAGWRRGVQVLGLIVHNAIEQCEPHELRSFADDAVTHFVNCVSAEAVRAGQSLTEVQADDIAHAFLAADIAFAEALPIRHDGKPS